LVVSRDLIAKLLLEFNFATCQPVIIYAGY